MMSDQQIGPTTGVLRLNDYRRQHAAIFFSRSELNQLLSLYSRQVAGGEWRDYAIDQQEGAAVFSVFRHTHESPLFTVVKSAPGAGRQGDFVVMSGRRYLAGGQTLGDVLGCLHRLLRKAPILLDGDRGI